ncbi:MAG: membrane protein insertase YidC [Planctomycetes bacterium]|nr:membrane protein insertase YidC [Planctomycetota bacterium]
MDPNQPSDRRPVSAFVVFIIFMATFFSVRSCQKAKEPPVAPPGESNAAPIVAEPAPAAVEGAPAFAATTGVERDDAIVVDTDRFRARFSNHGAVLLELLLKDYFRAPGDGADPAKRDDPSHWLPLLAAHDPAAATFELAHNARTVGSAALPLGEVNWAHERRPVEGGEQLVFKLEDGAGRRFEKRFTFRRESHLFDVELAFASDRAELSQGTSSYGLIAAGGIWDERNSPFAKPPAGVITSEDEDKLELLDAKSLEDGPQTRGFRRDELLPFFGARSNFFGFVIAPDAATAGYVDSVHCTAIDDPFRFEQERAKKLAGRAELAPEEAAELRKETRTNVRTESFLKVPFPAAGGAPLVLRFTAFAGPRTPAVMEGPQFDSFRVLYEIEYGGTTFRWINKLLLGWMTLLESFTGNWGVAIILLTLTVKVLLFPLNRLQSRTMEQFQKKMKLLQPQIEELKKRYKGNLQKMNQEQQKLMREHGVRPPIFGCLILFLQMPVWYGLFQIMSSAPPLRHQPFFGWISDLSAPDVVPLPFELPLIGQLHLLPILMVVAWLLQNRMMPKPADPQQAQMQKMMNFFPILFGVMLYKYAAGQSLYMLTNSLLGMVQMKFLKVTPSN